MAFCHANPNNAVCRKVARGNAVLPLEAWSDILGSPNFLKVFASFKRTKHSPKSGLTPKQPQTFS